MAFARYRGVAQDAAGNVIPNATVEVRRDAPGRPVVPLFSDRNGKVRQGNPITTNARGQFFFHAPGGVYYIRVFTGPSQAPFQEFTDRYVALGTAAERDVEDLARVLESGTAGFSTIEELQAFVPSTAEGVLGKVLRGAGAGFYHYDDTQEEGEKWIKDRPLFDTFARLTVVDGTANAIEAELEDGIDDASVKLMALIPEETNTGPVTLNGLPLKDVSGAALIAGQLMAGRSYNLTDEGDHYRLRQESDVTGVPAGIAAAAAAAMGEIAPAVEEAKGARDIAVPAASAALASQLMAEAALDAASILAGPIYLTEAAGLAAIGVGVGDPFVNISADAQWLERRIKDSTSASTLVARYPTASTLSSRVDVAVAKGLLFTFIDHLRRRTWVEARDTDGGPTDWSLSHILSRIEESRGLPKLINAPGILASIVDAANRQTWLTVRPKDGQWPDWVMNQFVDRLAPLLPNNLLGAPQYRWPDVRGSTFAIKGKDTYVRGGEVLPVLPNMGRMFGLGSSTMAGFSSNFSTMASGYGATYTNLGKGGELLEHTLARLGSRPALLTFPSNEIPASGSVTVTASNMPASSDLQSYTGTVGFGGVAGTLSSTASTITWTRTTAGSAVTVDPDMPFLPTLGGQCRADVGLFNVGKNSIVSLASGKFVAEQTDKAFDWMAPHIKRILVIGQFPDGFTSPAGPERQGIDYVNNWQRARYGAQFADLQAYLCSPPVWDHLALVNPGFTGPTSDDLAQQAIGNKPPSISADDGHLSADGRTTVRTYFIKPLIDSLGWYA
jgi:hypothetical protein